MFPRSRVNLFYRLLCLLSFLLVIIFINKFITILILMIAFYIFTLTERDIKIIFLYIITLIVFIICYSIKNYLFLRIMVSMDYIYYFLGVTYDNMLKEEVIRDQKYIRFNNITKKKVDNNMLCTMFVTIHILVLLLSIVVG